MQLFQKKNQINLQIILIIAFTLRAIWAWFVPVDFVADSYLYHAFAKSIATGNGYAFPNGDITAYWPVGTSAVYATLYYIFGISTLPIVIFNILISLVIVWLTYKIAERYLNQNVALTAAFFVALWPIMIEFTTIYASELIFILLILSALYIWGSEKITPNIRAILFGTLVCFATYTRPTALPILLLLPLAEWLTGGKLKAFLSSIIVASLTAAILFSPWVYRNYHVFGKVVLVSANGGANLWMGNHVGANGAYIELPNLNFKNEVERDDYFKNEAVKFIRENPLSYLKLAALRAVSTYKSETIGVLWNGYLEKNVDKRTILAMKLLSSLYWLALLLLGSIGAYNLIKDKKISFFHPLIVIPGFFFVFPLLTVGQDRYHLPINPFLAVFAAYFIQKLIYKRGEVAKSKQ